MNRRWLFFVAAMFLAVFVASAWHWALQPIPASPCRGEQAASCGDCHSGSMPAMHTPDFVDLGHGTVARDDRELCIDCHEDAQTCEDCHRSKPPTWETAAFRDPAGGPEQRAEHATIASEHRRSCGECHASSWRQQCATCHRYQEMSR